MPRITFEPQATPKQADTFMSWVGDMMHGCDCVEHAPPGKVFVGEMESRFIPCDLTLDPTKPESWARAVYEAGRRDCTHMGGGVTQQPAGKPVRVCHGTLESPPGDDDPGWVHAYIANTPPPNFVLNGVEYRPVTAPQSDPRSGACS